MKMPREQRGEMSTKRGGEQPVEAVLALALKAVALALGVAAIVLTAVRVSSLSVYVLLLSIGLVALAIGSILDMAALARALRAIPPITPPGFRPPPRGRKGRR